MTLANSVEKYLEKYVDLYHTCVEAKGKIDPKASAEIPCIVKSALETSKLAVDELAARGPGCGASSYFVIILKESGFDEMLEEWSIKKITKMLKKYSVPFAGCVVGGGVSVVKGFTTGRGGFVGGQLRASILFPVGCAAGSKLASEIYIYDKGWSKIKKIGALYEKFNEKVNNIYDALEAHHAQCEAPPSVCNPLRTARRIAPISWESRLPSETRLQPVNAEVERLRQTPIKITPLAPLPSNPLQDAVDAVINFSGDLTGVNPAIQEIKELKKLIETLIADPLKGPEAVVNALLKGPALKATPKKFSDLCDNLLTDPSLDAAWGITTGVFSIVTAIEPLLNLSDDIIQNPLKSPYIIGKALAQMQVQSVKGVMELGIQLVRDPLGLGKGLYKSIVQAPKHVGKSIERSVKRAFGKKKKRKKTSRVQPTAAELKLLAQKMGTAVQTCYQVGQERWYILPNKSADDYFKDLVSDWKEAQATKIYQGDFLQFPGLIQRHLATENFAEVRRLSPKAHAKETIAPLQAVLAFRDLAVETFALHTAKTKLKQAMDQDFKASQGLDASINTLKGKTDSLGALMDTPDKRAALRAKFASKMTDEALRKLKPS
ncbi:MAG: hypothetical protein ACK5MA_04660 [Parachlamydiaceae bacterium]